MANIKRVKLDGKERVKRIEEARKENAAAIETAKKKSEQRAINSAVASGKPYDAQFTASYIANDPNYQKWLDTDINTSSAKEIGEVIDVMRRMQAGINYRSQNNDSQSKYMPGNELYSINDDYNKGISENWLQSFFQKASEEDFNWLINDWQKKLDEAGEGDYKKRTQEDLDVVKEYARNNFSSFANEEIRRIGEEIKKTKEDNAGISTAYDADLLADANAAIEAGRGGFNLYDYVANRNSLRSAVGFDELEAQYEDPDEFNDELRRRLERIAAQGTAAQDKYNQDMIPYQQRLAELNSELDAAQGVYANLLEGNRYRQMLEEAGFLEDGRTYALGVKPFEARSAQEVTTDDGLGNQRTEIRYTNSEATLDQIVADPQRVINQLKQQENPNATSLYMAELAATMTLEERLEYFGIKAKYGEERAENYFDWKEDNGTGARRNAQLIAEQEAYAREHPIAASIGSVALKPIAALGGTAAMIDAAFGGDVKAYDPRLETTQITNEMRTTVGEEIAAKWDYELPVIGNVGVFFYNTAMSIADMSLATAMGAGLGGGAGTQAAKRLTQLIMSSGAATDAFTTAIENGDDPQEAFVQSFAAGLIEAATEKYSIDALFSDKSPVGLRNAFKYIAKNAFTEGTEEIAADIMNDVVDIALNWSDAELLEKLEYYRSNGYTDKEAALKLLGETAAEYARSGLAGTISGAAISATITGAQNIEQQAEYRSIGRQIIENGQAAQLINAGLKSTSKSAKQTAERLARKITDAGLPTDAETAAEIQVLAEEVSNAEAAAATANENYSDAKKAFKEAKLDFETAPADMSRNFKTALEADVADAENAMQEAGAAQQEAGKAVEEAKANYAANLQDVNQRISNLFKRGSAKIGKLYTNVMNALDIDIQNKSRADIAAAIKNRFGQLGKNILDDEADAMAGAVLGEDVDPEKLNMLEADSVRDGILKELILGINGNWASDLLGDATKALIKGRDALRNALAASGSTGTTTSMRRGGRSMDDDGDMRAMEYAQAEIAAEKRGTPAMDDDGDPEAMLQARAESMNDSNAGAEMIRLSKGVTNTRAYANAFEAAYDYGSIGLDKKTARTSQMTTGLTDEQFEAAYNAGQQAEATAAPVAARKAGGRISFTPSVKAKLSDRTALDGNQRAGINALRRIAEMGIVNIEVFESQADEAGSYAAYENGSYNPETNTIRIDINAGRNKVGSVASYALLRTASHELTHFIKAQNTDGYKALRAFVSAQLTKDGSNTFDGLVARKMDLQPDLAYAQAVEEVVADGCEMMLKDSTAIQQLAKENKGLFNRIRNWIKNFVASVKRAFRGVSVTSAEARLIKDMDGMQKLWDDALVQAGRNVRKAAVDGIDFSKDGNVAFAESPAAMQSLRSYNESDYIQDRDKAAAALAKRMNISNAKAKAYIDDVTSIAAMVAADRDRLDFEAEDEYSAMKHNSEYKFTMDFSTLCKKRLLYTGTFDAIQRQLGDTALTEDDYIQLRQMMAERGYEVACAFCYVESRRKNNGTIINKFLEEYKAAQKNGTEMELGPSNRRKAFATEDGFTPKISDFNTSEGIANIMHNHRGVYDAYMYFMNARGVSKPKLIESRTDYRSEILSKFRSASAVRAMNRRGGLRLQSFSDFEVVNMLDMMQVVMDMSRVGLMSQAYTKVPEFARVFGGTGVKINLSLVTKGVDANGRLIFDDIEGMPHREAFRIRDMYSDHVGTILVGKDDATIRAAMADPRIDFIIPYHASGWSTENQNALGIGGYTNFTAGQNETDARTGKTVKNFQPSEYWDYSKTGDENAQVYLEKCREAGRIPKFPQYQNFPGYWKMLIDFKMYNNEGVGSPQRAVRPDFNLEEARNIMDDYKGGHQNLPVAQDVVRDFVQQYKEKNRGGDVMFSKRMDEEYQEAYDDYDEVRARELVEQAAIAAGYNPLKLYHGTKSFGFTKVDPSKADDGISFFTAADDMVAQTYVGEDARIRRLGGKDGITVDQLTNADGRTLLPLLHKYFNEAYELVGQDEVLELVGDEGVLIRKRIIPKVEALRKAVREQFEEWPLDAEKENSILKAYDAIVDTLNRLSYAKNYSQVDDLFDAYYDALADLRELDDTASSNVGYAISEDLRQRASNMRMYLDGDLFKAEGEWEVEYLTSNQAINMLAPKVLNGIYELYGKTDNLLEIDGKGANWNRLDGGFLLGKTYATTRDFAEYAKEMGFDGVHFQNIHDVGGLANYNASSDIYTFFNPSDVKSADPFTFDDDGNLIPLSERFKQGNADIRYSKRLSEQEMAMLHEKVGEIAIGKEPQFKKSRNGEYIFAIGNKLVYNDGRLGNPYISKVVTINVGDETDTDAARQIIFKYEEGELTGEQARRILTQSYGTGAVRGHDFGVHRPVRRKDGRGKGRTGSEVSERNRVTDNREKFSIRTDNLSDREILAEAFENVAQNDTERSYISQYREKINDLNEKQGRLAEVRGEIRDMMFTPGKRSEEFKGRLNRLKNEAKQLSDYINRIDKRLLAFENAKPLQDVLARERAKVEKQSAEKRRESMARVRDRRNATEIRHKIKAILDDFNRRLKNPTEKSYIPQGFVHAVIAAEELVNTDSGRAKSTRAQEKLAAIQGVYERYKNDPTFAYAYDPIISDMLNNLSSVVGNKTIYQLNSTELQAVYDALKALKKQVTEAVKLKAGDYARTIFEAGREMALETAAAAPLAKGKAGEFLNWQLTPDKFFERLAGYKKDSTWSKVARTFSEGTQRMLEIQREHYYHFKRFTESKEFDKLSSQKNLVDIGLKDANGKTVKVTRGMMLSAYMHLLNEENARGFMYGGFSIPNLKAYYAGDVKGSYGTGSANTRGTASELAELAEQMRDPDLTEEQLQEMERRHEELIMQGEARLAQMRAGIAQQLTQYEKDLIRAIQEWNDGKSQQYINEVTMDLYGIKKASVQNYFPIHRDTAFVTTDFESISRNVNLENWGSLKQRVPSQAPILLTDIAYEMDSTLNQMSRYVGYARAQRDFNKLYNVRLPGMNGSVKKAVGVKFGSGGGKMGVSGAQYIENYIGSITGSRRREDSFLTPIRRNLVRATMTTNLRVAFSQLSAIPKAAAEVGWGNMSKGFLNGGFKAIFSTRAREELARQNVWFWQRYRGEGGQREFADAKGGTDVISKVWNWVDDKTKGWLLNWCQSFDVMSTVSMWSMAKEWARKNTNFAEGSAEFTEAANRKYTDIIRNTQAMSTTTERSDLARSTSEMVGLLNMFKSEAFANFNMFYDAFARLRKYNADLKAGKNGVTKADVTAAKKHAIGVATSVIIGASLGNAVLKLAINALTHAMNGYRNDEDEVTLKSTLTAIGQEVAGDTAGMIAFGGDVYDLVAAAIMGEKYYGMSDMALSEITEAFTTAINVLQKEDAGMDDYMNAAKKLTFNITNMLGIPAENWKRYWTGAEAWIEEAQTGMIGTWEGGVQRSNSTNYSRLYNAAIAGDDEKFDRVMLELMDNGVEEKDALSGFRTRVKEAYREGELTREEATEMLVSNGGKDKNEAYWLMDEWDYTGEENYSKYADLEYALEHANASDAQAAIAELTKHGVKEETVYSRISTMYNDGTAANLATLKIRAGRLYSPSKPKNTADDFDGLIQAIVSGGNISSEMQKVQNLGYSTKNIMTALNSAFGKSTDAYINLMTYNPADGKRLEERILDAYALLGMNREEERKWIRENWIK